MIDKRLKSEIPYHERFKINLNHFEDASVFEWELSVRTENCLRREKISMQSELLNLSEENLLDIKSLGMKSLKELEAYIKTIADEQKGNEQGNELSSYHIPKNLRKYVEDFIKGDFEAINSLSLSPREQEFMERFVFESSLIEESLREEAYLGSDTVIDIVLLLKRFINSNERKRELRNKFSGYLNRTNTQRLDLLIEPFLASFHNEELKNIISSTYYDMKIGDLNVYVDLVRSFDVTEKAIIQLLEHITFNINVDFNSALNSTIKNFRDLLVVDKRSNGLTLEEVGEELGVTRERVRQIEAKVVKKLLSWLVKYGLIEKVFALNGNIQLISIDEISREIAEQKQLFIYIMHKYIDELVDYEYIETINSVVAKNVFDNDKINEVVDTLPDYFDESECNSLLDKQVEDKQFTSTLKKFIHSSYTKTGKVYHRRKLKLTDIYRRVLYKYYPDGIKVFDNECMSQFRKTVVNEFGEMTLPINDRAIAARIVDIATLCDRGTYKSKERVDFNIDPNLINEIRVYIDESKREIVLISSIFNVFKTRLIMHGIDNRYYLHGILREMFEDDYFFNKDCVLKNRSDSTISDEISNFIRDFDYPVTQDRIREEFPGATEVMIGRAIAITDIVNLYGKYIHIDKLGIDEHKLAIIEQAVEELISDVNIHHAKDLYYKIDQERPSFWSQLYVDYPFSSFSVAEILLGDKYQFERPFFSIKGLKINGKEELLRLEFENENKFSVTRVHELAKHYKLNFTSIYSLLEIIMDSHYLVDKNLLIKEENIFLSQSMILEIEDLIIDSLKDEKVLLIRFLPCIPQLPDIGFRWNEWLLLSFVKKHSTRLEVELSSMFYAKSYPIVSLVGSMNREKYLEIKLDDKEDVVHDMSNVDDLLDDLMEIEF